ncbi:MAG TPA: TonB-dependent receptor [Steroidobacteraceae bacterium]
MPGAARSRVVIILTVSLFLEFASLSAHAQIRFDLPSQPLAQALTSIGNLANLNVYFDPSLVDGHQAPALKAEVSVEEALNRLLAGTKLRAVRVDENTVRVVADPGEKRAQNTHSADTGAVHTPGGVHLAYVGPPPVEPQGGERLAKTQSEVVLPTPVAEVVVSAEKRDERLQDVPVPVTALRADALLNSNQLQLQDYYTSVPGLSLATSVESAQLLSIRGVTTGGTTNPTVGIVVDDVPYGASTELGGGQVVPDIDPGDLARVEVLRGPQGTLYGASSMGGLLKFVTVDPSTDHFFGRVQAGISGVHSGNDPGYDARAAFNIPLTDTLAMRVSGFTRQEPGYIDNPILNINNLNEQRASGGRLSALWKPSDALSLKLSALYQNTKADGSSDVDVQPGLGDLQQNYLRGIGGYDRQVQAYSATLNAKLGGIDLTSITGYNVNSHSDSWDFTYRLGAFTDGIFGVTGTPVTADNRTNKFTEELRMTAPLGSNVDWLLGGFYTHESSHYAETILAVDALTGAQAGVWGTISFPTTYTEYAAFTDFTFRFTDQFDVQFGGRESVIKQSSSESNIGDAYDTNFLGLASPVYYPQVDTRAAAFTYLVTPRYKIAPHMMLYARLASGYRAGGPNAAPGVPRGYDPDKTENYEIGFKGDVLSHLLTLDASVYYINWKDIQISLYDAQVAQSYNANGSKAVSRGVEFSVQSRPLPGLDVNAWVSYDHAALTQTFPAAALAYGASGDRLPYTARFTGNFSVQQDFPIYNTWTGFLGAMVSYVGDRQGVFLATPQRQYLPAYAKTDLRAGARYDTWTLNLYANNVTDRRGVISGGLGSFPPFGFTLIQPRLIGLSLVKAF